MFHRAIATVILSEMGFSPIWKHFRKLATGGSFIWPAYEHSPLQVFDGSTCVRNGFV